MRIFSIKFVHLKNIRKKKHYFCLIYQKLLSMIDTSKHVLAISDSLKINEFEFDETIKRLIKDTNYYNYSEALNNFIRKKKKSLRVEISKIINSGKYRLTVDFQNHKFNNNLKYPKFEFSFYGVLTLSRIYFNNSHENGFFVCSFYCGTDCHSSYIVFIRKENQGWKIEEFKLLSIA